MSSAQDKVSGIGPHSRREFDLFINGLKLLAMPSRFDDIDKFDQLVEQKLARIIHQAA